jgi:hypothetical protein
LTVKPSTIISIVCASLVFASQMFLLIHMVVQVLREEIRRDDELRRRRVSDGLRIPRAADGFESE